MLRLHGNHPFVTGKQIPSYSLFRLLYPVNFRQTVGREIIVPRSIAYMFLRHHSVPLASRHFFVVFPAQFRIAPKRLLHLVGPLIRLRIVLLVQFVIHGLCIVHFIQIGHRLHRKKNQLAISIPVSGLQFQILPQGFRLQLHIFIGHLPPFPRSQVISILIQHLGSHASIVLAIQVQDTHGLIRLFLTELLRTERSCMLQQIPCRIAFRIPSHIHKKSDRILHRLQITHIQYPKLIHPIAVSQLKLFPHILYRSYIQPFGITGSPHIIYMIIHPPSAGMLPLLCIRQPAHIPPVVITQQHNHIIGHTESHVIIALHFFINSPYLRTFLRCFSRHFLDNATLIPEYLLHQAHVFLITRHIFVIFPLLSTHRSITVTSHTNGNQIFRIGRTLHTFTEKTVNHLLVGSIVPCPIFAALSHPFLMIACHRFMV